MKVYVAAHCRYAAKHVAAVLSEHGHEIVSRWLADTFEPTESYSEPRRREIAQEDHDDIFAADALALLAGPDRYPGGKFVEAGIAIGAGKRVVVIGRRENMLLWLTTVDRVDSPEDAARLLAADGP